MRIRPDSARLRAFVRASVLRAGVSVAVIVATTSVPLIRIRAVTGRFFKRLALIENPVVQSLTTFFLGRGFADSFSVGDFPDIVPNKRPADGVGATDVREPFVIDKGLTENPKVEEGDYFAEDYTDPGYTIISFTWLATKPFAEPLTLGDIAAVGIGSAFTESPTVSDAVFSKDIIAATEKVLTADITDIAAAALIRVLGNSAVTNDTRVAAVSKELVDATQTFDAQSLATAKGLTDAAQTTDAQLLAAAKGLTDTTAFVDTQILAGAKALADTSAVGDASVTVGMVRVVLDGTATAELVALGANVSIIDTSSVADSGNLRTQDYCDFDYFAEDYVGEVRTF